MTTLDATASHIDFSPLVKFGSTIGLPSAALFTWGVPGGTLVTASGSGFIFNASNVPTGGTVTSISIDYALSDGIADVTLTGLSAPLASLVNASNPDLGQVSFWETVLGGNDTLYAPFTHGGRLFGDFLQVIADSFDIGGTFRAGGDDVIHAGSTSWTANPYIGGVAQHALIGDAQLVQGVSYLLNGHPVAVGAYLTGGSDTILAAGLSGFNLVGDAQDVENLGHVTGGNDKITSTATGAVLYYSGDVEVNNGGAVTGGNDTVNGSPNAGAEDSIAGDVMENKSGAVQGGRDVLNGRGGNDRIAGDVMTMFGGSMTGAADTIHGGAGSDEVFGDVFSSDGRVTAAVVTMTCGNDKLFGDGGNDTLVGDFGIALNTDAASTLNCGNDKLFGGTGDDHLYGDTYVASYGFSVAGGNDTLDGGLGNDYLDGQGGIDTASFASVAAAVTVDLAAGVADGQGHDFLYNIENIAGSSLGDILSGDGGANRIDGGAGGDVIDGRAGSDRLNGGAGADRFVYNSTGDSGITAATRDIIFNWDAGDVIDVSAIDARPAAGDQKFSVITSGAPGVGQMRIVTLADKVILQFNTDADATLEMTVEIRTALAVTAADFIL